MEQKYISPLAKWSRIFEIIIPGYMFGKSWGISDEKTVDLFRAEFPAFLVNMAEFIKGFFQSSSHSMQFFWANCAGACVGFLVIAVLAVIMHFALGNRKYINSLRFTAITLIPLAVLNGLLSHGVKQLVENLDVQSVDVLTKSAVQTPWGYFVVNFIFYMIALWMFGRRTGVRHGRRWRVIAVGIAFVALYLGCGLMITPGEWNELLPKLQQSLVQYGSTGYGG